MVVLYGGYWEEREISIDSASRVVEALREGGLRVTPVRWDFDGWLEIADGQDLRDPGPGRAPLRLLRALQDDGLGVVFNSLHGGPGEDGSVQGFFEVAGPAFETACANAVDDDGDGFVDCADTDCDVLPPCSDLCPDDPDKEEPGICGCGTPDTDTDADGTADCEDLCPDDPDDDADNDGVCVGPRFQLPKSAGGDL